MISNFPKSSASHTITSSGSPSALSGAGIIPAKPCWSSGRGAAPPRKSATSQTTFYSYPTAMDTIGEEEKFYGYVIGLQVERHPEPKPVGTRLYATFEYNGEVSVWEVPDPKLFEIL